MEFFISTLLEMKASFILQDLNLNYLCVTGLPDYWQLPPGVTPSDLNIFGEENSERLRALKHTLLETVERDQLEITLGTDVVFEFRIHTFTANDGSRYLATIILDRSEDLRRERLLRALLREVSHRSKNLLAIIQSIAAQTARYSDSLHSFLGKFRGRIYSLSQSQDLITDSSWRGTYFVELVEGQTDKYLADNSRLIRITGENPLLSPNASLHLGLALHELIVNAVSHGNLGSSNKSVEISCSRVMKDGEPWLDIRWLEPRSSKSLADDTEARLPSFGSTVLERVVPASVNGIARYTIGKTEITYDLSFPEGIPN
ncbi:sensor histidine kinase [Rhizobium halophytocola]|uniref:histidine kinase n=1 Tax=Rhizobium halophytocola TaxID=735519 RepID=A0ABS4E0H1_9HYPH|nr:sensor histidine kinase [Rhizobium halophytocola]MBP1851438.1 two-component sensor histidine kinase [Rhizobium halophytocola]